MKKTAVLLAMWVAFVVFLDGAALAGAFGNDLLELTSDQELVVRAALGEQVTVRVKVAENIPMPQIPAAPAQAATSVAAPVAQAPVNYQPPIAPSGPVPYIYPPVQTVRSMEPPAVQPRQPETRVASAPPVKPVAPVAATPAPAVKSAAPVNREPLAKAEPTLKPDKEVREVCAMEMPIQRLPEQFTLPNGKAFKKLNSELYEVTNGTYRYVGNTPWLVVEEINKKANEAGATFMNAPPAGAKKEPYKG